MPADPTPSVNPGFAAKHIAGLLDADPVMARLVKEHLSPERLREVLELPLRDLGPIETLVAGFDRKTNAEIKYELEEFLDPDL